MPGRLLSNSSYASPAHLATTSAQHLIRIRHTQPITMATAAFTCSGHNTTPGSSQQLLVASRRLFCFQLDNEKTIG
ncbi:hypothetical protein Taro_021843 [Colocasia esculenta]|uniref:Uncharacterized protein n=1 Tax=Colocasia esculenta TaxID=4460 RepID=A0A843V064_COLES|nr:hypothetical protein [Colocasia esculenta]